MSKFSRFFSITLAVAAVFCFVSCNKTQKTSMHVNGKACGLSDSLVADVTDYYTIANGILAFDSVRGPSYHINLNTSKLLSSSSDHAALTSCKEIASGIWEITVKSDEMPESETFVFDERFQTSKAVAELKGNTIQYLDGTYETISIADNGNIEFFSGKYNKNCFTPVYHCLTSVNSLQNFNAEYTSVEPTL